MGLAVMESSHLIVFQAACEVSPGWPGLLFVIFRQRQRQGKDEAKEPCAISHTWLFYTLRRLYCSHFLQARTQSVIECSQDIITLL